MTMKANKEEMLQSALDAVQEVLEFAEDYTDDEIFAAIKTIPETLWQTYILLQES